MTRLSSEITQGDMLRCTARGWSGTREQSEVVKLYRITEGRCWVQTEGEPEHLEAGQLYLIPPTPTLSFGCDKDFFVQWFHAVVGPTSLELRLRQCAAAVPCPPALLRRWDKAAPPLLKRGTHNSLNGSLRLSALLMQAIAYAIKNQNFLDPATQRAYQRIGPGIRLLRREAMEHPTLAQAAEAAHVSPEHFHRVFKSLMGTTPRAYALGFRMRRARGLLVERQWRVHEAAEHCGYTDPAHFSKAYSAYHGQTPSQARNAGLPPRP